MKKIFTTIVCIISISFVHAQKQTYDLFTYTAPKNWVKEVKELTYTSYTINNTKTNEYCRVYLMASVNSKGSLIADFENEWQNLVASQYSLTKAVELTKPEMKNGWQTQTGLAPFTAGGFDYMAMLYTLTGFGKTASVVSVTNTSGYNAAIMQFINSIEMKKPGDAATTQQPTITQGNLPKTLTDFAWKRTSNKNDGIGGYGGYASNTYRFNTNGTYQYSRVDYQQYAPKFSMVDEEGTFTVSGNRITLKPSKCFYHQHKSNKADPAFKSGNLTLETAQYSFEFIDHYGKWALILAPSNGNETVRDGKFNFYTGGDMTRSYIYNVYDK